MKAFLSILVFVFLSVPAFAGGGRVTNEMIYQKLLELEKRQIVLETQFREFRKATEQRFTAIDKRFEDMNRRFEELREDVNRRFEEMRADVNKRFEEHRETMQEEFRQLYTFLWIITGIFATLTAVVIGFALWDRRTTVRRAREEAVEEVERIYGVSRIRDLISALRDLSQKDQELARVLRHYGLL